MYCIDLISSEQLQYDTRYRYRVRWSIPTRRLPVPRFTAAVYFTITSSKIKPKVRVLCSRGGDYRGDGGTSGQLSLASLQGR